MKQTYTLNEASKQLGYKSLTGICSMLRTSGVIIKGGGMLPTNGKGFHTVTLEQLSELKVIKASHNGFKFRPNEKERQRIRRLFQPPILKVETVMDFTDNLMPPPPTSMKTMPIAAEPVPDVKLNRTFIHRCAILLAKAGHEAEAMDLLKFGEA